MMLTQENKQLGHLCDIKGQAAIHKIHSRFGTSGSRFGKKGVSRIPRQGEEPTTHAQRRIAYQIEGIFMINIV